MYPTIGRIVTYTAGESDKEFMRGIGNCNVQDKLPAIVTAVWGEDCVNLQVILDGDGTLWKTSVSKGDGEYNWDWPQREEKLVLRLF